MVATIQDEDAFSAVRWHAECDPRVAVIRRVGTTCPSGRVRDRVVICLGTSRCAPQGYRHRSRRSRSCSPGPLGPPFPTMSGVPPGCANIYNFLVCGRNISGNLPMGGTCPDLYLYSPSGAAAWSRSRKRGQLGGENAAVLSPVAPKELIIMRVVSHLVRSWSLTSCEVRRPFDRSRSGTSAISSPSTRSCNRGADNRCPPWPSLGALGSLPGADLFTTSPASGPVSQNRQSHHAA